MTQSKLGTKRYMSLVYRSQQGEEEEKIVDFTIPPCDQVDVVHHLEFLLLYNV